MGTRVGTNPLTVTATVPHIMLRAADEIGTWLVATVGTVGVVLLGRHWRRDRRPYGDPLDGWLFMGAVAAWLAVVPSSLDLVDWTFSGRDVVSALLLLATVPLLVAGAMVEAVRRSSSGLEQTSHRVLEWVLMAAGIAVVYTGLVGGLGSLFGKNGPTWFLVATTGAIALIAEPTRHRIQRLVDHLVYGARDDPLGVVQRVLDHVGTDAGDDLLPRSGDQSRAGAPPRLRGHRPRGSRWLATGGVGRSRNRHTIVRSCSAIATTSSAGWSSGGPTDPRSGRAIARSSSSWSARSASP